MQQCTSISTAALRDQQVLRLQVPVQDAPRVTVRQAAQQLVQKQLHTHILHNTHYSTAHYITSQHSTMSCEAAARVVARYLNVEQMHQVAALVHVLLEVALDELEHKRQRVGRVDDVVQSHDVRVLQAAQQRHCTRTRYNALWIVQLRSRPNRLTTVMCAPVPWPRQRQQRHTQPALRAHYSTVQSRRA